MKKFLFIAIALLSMTVASAQSYNSYAYRSTIFTIGVDLNVPIGDFAKSEYRLAPGADEYLQEGTFNPALGITAGLEIPLGTEFSLRPTFSYMQFNGRHEVGDFDSPKMNLLEMRIGCDGIYYLVSNQREDIYILGSAGLNIERLTVKRWELLKEEFSSQRPTIGVGVGYAFGKDKALLIEASCFKSIGGNAPCDESFPALSFMKLSLSIKI